MKDVFDVAIVGAGPAGISAACVLAGAGLKLPKPRKEGYLYLATVVPDGLLSDIAPTVLELLNLEKPAEMTGISLLPNLLKQIS